MVDKKKYAIVDFSTTEVVRGSFGYDSYLLYAAMKHLGYDVDMFEDISPFKLHRESKHYDKYIIHFWSYPQTDSIKWAEFNLQGDKSYIGYKPLIDKYKLPHCQLWTNENILIGMKYLPTIYKEMKYGLMSDCDLHIKSSDKRSVMPLFTSYGCPNQCEFCPIPPNRGCYGKDARIFLQAGDLFECLDMAFDGNRNIHFCDEDMFVNVEWMKSIVDFLINKQDFYKKSNWKPFKWIGLGSVNTFYNYLEKYGQDDLIKSGCHLIEIGIEAENKSLRKSMNKTGTEKQIWYILNKSEKINKFWLTVTFFPGETISTLNQMGDWLRKNGTKKSQLSSRLITNGNVGGLGQFFQPYEGVKKYEDIVRQGHILTEYPVRLMPSFIPFSFSSCIPVGNNKKCEIDGVLYTTVIIREEDKFWFKTYNIDINKYKKVEFKSNYTIQHYIREQEYDIKFIVYLALLCRLGYLHEGDK